MNKNEKNRDSLVFDFIRFPLILLVVYIHVLPFKMESLSLDVSWNNLYIWISSLISQNIGNIAVPCFFVISGYFYFLKMKEWNWDFYKQQQIKRIKTLVIPYVIFNTLNILIIILKEFIFNKISGSNASYEDIYILKENNIFDLYIGIPIDYPLWYLRDLIVMTFFSFFFYYLFNYLNVFGLIILFICYYFLPSLPFVGFSQIAILYFAIGAYFGIKKKSIIGIFEKIRCIAIPLSILLVLISTCFNGVESCHYYIIKIFIPFGVISAFVLSNRVVNIDYIKRISLNLGKYVFFIYAMHSIYIINWVKGFLYRTSLYSYGLGMIIIYFIIPIIVIFVCILLYKCVNIISPKTLKIICGNR